MRLKLDKNLPAALVEKPSGLGHDVDTVPAEDLRGHPDLDIWEATQREQRFLVTQDLDFRHSAVQARNASRPSARPVGQARSRRAAGASLPAIRDRKAGCVGRMFCRRNRGQAEGVSAGRHGRKSSSADRQIGLRCLSRAMRFPSFTASYARLSPVQQLSGF
jgi:hypothetical protein